MQSNAPASASDAVLGNPLSLARLGDMTLLGDDRVITRLNADGSTEPFVGGNYPLCNFTRGSVLCPPPVRDGPRNVFNFNVINRILPSAATNKIVVMENFLLRVVNLSDSSVLTGAGSNVSEAFLYSTRLDVPLPPPSAFPVADGTGTNAWFHGVRGGDGVFTDSHFIVYLTEHPWDPLTGPATDNRLQRVRRVNTSDWSVSTLAGGIRDGSFDFTTTDGDGSLATFFLPEGLVALGSELTGNLSLYIADCISLRKLTFRIGDAFAQVSTFAGGASDLSQGASDGIGTNAEFNCLVTLAFDAQQQILYGAEEESLRAIDLNTAQVSTLWRVDRSRIPRGYFEDILLVDKGILLIAIFSRGTIYSEKDGGVTGIVEALNCTTSSSALAAPPSALTEDLPLASAPYVASFLALASLVVTLLACAVSRKLRSKPQSPSAAISAADLEDELEDSRVYTNPINSHAIADWASKLHTEEMPDPEPEPDTYSEDPI
jgi:hypothetical protein